MPMETRPASGHRVDMRMRHRTRVKDGDLVVLFVGGDERLGGEGVHLGQVPARDPGLVHPVRVRPEVVAHGRHRERVPSEELEVVRDVPPAPSVLAPHLGGREGDADDVHSIGEDVVPKAVRERHEGVVGERTADERRHGRQDSLARGAMRLQFAERGNLTDFRRVGAGEKAPGVGPGCPRHRFRGAGGHDPPAPSPPSGPRSITQSAARTRRDCARSRTTVFPRSTSRSSTRGAGARRGK